MVALAYRRLGAIFEGKENSPHPLDLLKHIVGGFWIWLEGPHGRWFDKLLGAIYAILAIVFALGIATLLSWREIREQGAERFLGLQTGCGDSDAQASPNRRKIDEHNA